MPLQWPELPLSVGNDHYWLHHPLEVCIRKIIYTCPGHVGLSLIVAASGFVI
jgi:hypothetical protein